MTETADWPQNPFWDFSIALYRKPGVPPACLALQERHGIDVNLLLYFVWTGSRGLVLSADQVAAAVDQVRAWHDGVVRPLRALRTELKGDVKGAPPVLAERLRNQIKSAELNAERIEQQMLHAVAPATGGQGRDAARANIVAYFNALKTPLESADWEAVDTILGATGL